MHKLIMFDIGGVVTHTDFKKLYSDFATRIGIDPNFVVNYHKEFLDDLLLGNKSLDEFWDDMRKAGAKEDLDVRQAWLDEALKIRSVDMDLLALIDKLRENYKVCTLTNLTPSRLIIDQAQDLYSHFDDNILSCVEHVKKPDPAFYELALKKFGIEANEGIFVDDKQSLIDVADSLGIKGILFKNTAKLRNDFNQAGVKI